MQAKRKVAVSPPVLQELLDPPRHIPQLDLCEYLNALRTLEAVRSEVDNLGSLIVAKLVRKIPVQRGYLAATLDLKGCLIVREEDRALASAAEGSLNPNSAIPPPIDAPAWLETEAKTAPLEYYNITVTALDFVFECALKGQVEALAVLRQIAEIAEGGAVRLTTANSPAPESPAVS